MKMNKKSRTRFCKDCGKKLNRLAYFCHTKRCKSCANKFRPNHLIHGESLKKHYCIDCKETEICYENWRIGSKRCRSCASKGKNNSNYKQGNTLKKYYCLDCDKELSNTAYIQNTKRCNSCAQKERMKDPLNHHMFGKHHSDETKNKMSAKAVERFKDPSNHPMYDVHRFGEESPNWLGGISEDPYPLEFTEKLKELIKDRDNHKCQICNIHQKDLDREISVHHIDYNKRNCEDTNLISLCCSCHMKTNFN